MQMSAVRNSNRPSIGLQISPPIGIPPWIVFPGSIHRRITNPYAADL